MKKCTILLLCSFLFARLFSQTDLTPADWQADLRFLQETVHKDYPHLFKKITQEKWDAEVEKLHQAIPSLQPTEILAGFGRTVASFGYGHTDIGWSRSPLKYHVLPINLYWFSDGIFIEGVHKDYQKILGAKLLKIEGMPVEQAMEAIRPLIPVENEQYFKSMGVFMLRVPEALHAQKVTKELKTKITLTLEREGKIFEHTVAGLDAQRAPTEYGYVIQDGNDWLSARDQKTMPYFLKNIEKIYYFEYLPEKKTLYVRHSQIQDDEEPIPAFYKRVFDFIEKNDVERLVLDVRLNGGGNNYKNKPIVTGIIRCEKINQPGKLFVIIGRNTFSACQNLVNELSNYTNAIFVGEPTSENINFYGDNRRVELPNSKLQVFLSFAWWQDKPQWENADWQAPHLAVEMSFEDYRSNHDPVLEAALNTSANDVLIDPIGYLRGLFQEKKFEQLQVEAAQMVKDPKYRFFDFEDKFNQAGYNYLNRKQFEPAIQVFQLNTQLFPKSANTWDSLGEAHWKSGQMDKATECYNKAIELDPNGVTGENARNMLSKIKGGK
ncbi:MAG: tetratricopeptide repeat protein [Saprospiraceae bacterium]